MKRREVTPEPPPPPPGWPATRAGAEGRGRWTDGGMRVGWPAPESVAADEINTVILLVASVGQAVDSLALVSVVDWPSSLLLSAAARLSSVRRVGRQR